MSAKATDPGIEIGPGLVVEVANANRVVEIEEQRSSQSLTLATGVVITYEAERGPAGRDGEDGRDATTKTFDVVAAEPIPYLHVATIRPDGLAYLADADDTADGQRLVGVAVTSALAGETVAVMTEGLTESGSPLPVGTLFLGNAGALTADPEVGLIHQVIGYGLTANLLAVRPGRAIIRSI